MTPRSGSSDPTLPSGANVAGREPEWYRWPDWSPADQVDFEARLKRSWSSNRHQYLRIKGLALAADGQTDAAKALFLRVLDSEDEFSELSKAGALENLADLHMHSDPAEAERYLRRLLAEYPTLNATTGMAEVTLAEILVKRRNQSSVIEAMELLRAWVARDRSPFPINMFRWHLVLIDAAEIMGDRETARSSARTALELVEMGPVFPRHKTVGVVHAEAKTLKRLKKLAKT